MEITIRLIGIRGNGLTDREAVAWLEEATKNQRVFLVSERKRRRGEAAD